MPLSEGKHLAVASNSGVQTVNFTRNYRVNERLSHCIDGKSTWHCNDHQAASVLTQTIENPSSVGNVVAGPTEITKEDVAGEGSHGGVDLGLDAVGEDSETGSGQHHERTLVRVKLEQSESFIDGLINKVTGKSLLGAGEVRPVAGQSHVVVVEVVGGAAVEEVDLEHASERRVDRQPRNLQTFNAFGADVPGVSGGVVETDYGLVGDGGRRGVVGGGGVGGGVLGEYFRDGSEEK